MSNNFMPRAGGNSSVFLFFKWNKYSNKRLVYSRYLLLMMLFCFANNRTGKSFSGSSEKSSLNFISANTAFAYNEGDYRPLSNNADFAQGGSAPYYWEIFVSGSWVSTPVSPQSIKPSRIIIDKPGINGGTSSANSYNDIVIINGGELILSDDAILPAQNFLNSTKTLEVQSGGKLIINGDIKLANTTFLIIRNGGAMILDQNSISNIHPMWDGAETFEGGSTVTIKDWKWSASFNEKSLIENAGAISNNMNGYKFGNLIFDINPTSLWTIISGATGIVSLCENDLYINNSSSNFVTGASNESGINGFIVNGNMTINKGPFGFGSSYSADNFNHQFTINGTFECRSSSALKIHHTVIRPDSLDGFVTFKNNVIIAPSVNEFSNDVASKANRRMYINFNGGTSTNPLLIDIAPTAIAISMNVKANSYVQLKEHDLNTNSKSSNTAIITVENLATLDFGWAPDGITPLVIKKNGTVGTNNFVTLAGSIIKITSADGISETTAAGNVQYAGASNKTFNQAATFWYTGKVNQVTGDGLSITGSARQVIIDMDNNNLSTTLTQSFRLTNATTASPTGGKLDIRKGQFLETPTAFIEGVINENGSGTLYMSAGTLYRISSLSSVGGQSNIPRMSGVTFSYKLDGGTIELSAAGDQTLRGNKAYRNLTFSNSGVKTVSSAPTSITGTLLIKDDAVLNVDVNAMGGAGTDFTMEGNSKYITAGVLTKPDAQGAYTLGTGTTIEFTNSNNMTVQEIRLGLSSENPIAYNHIIVSGNNVGNLSIASTPITMQSGSTFTVTGTGIFRLRNENGFSGAANTCLTAVPVIYLEDGATIDYNRDNGTNQNISSQQPYKNLLLSGLGNKTAPAGNLIIKGDLISDTANFVHNNGTVILNGSNFQTLRSNAPEILFYNLTNNNMAGVFVNNDIAVYKELLLGANSKTILNTGNIILKSDKNNTANVAKIPGSSIISYNTGLFVAERYINTGLIINGQHFKSWQFLSAPVFGESIASTWQENKLILNDYGTWITNNDLSNWNAQGFDSYSNSPSMKTYDAMTNKWIGIPNTNINIENQKGYMLFVRGDRTVNAIGQDAKPTTLRAKGKIYSPHAGFIPQPISIMPGSYESIGNPYASRIDMEYMYDNNLMTGVDGSFYIWDPLLYGSYGLGGYQTISKNLGYKPVPGIPGNPTQYYDPAVKSNFIESGQAFFVHNNSGINGSVTFTEDCKANGSRLVHKETNENVENEILKAYLYTQDENLADGNAVVFGNDFSNSIDQDDALKILNSGENFGLSREQKVLAIEARKPIDITDTIFFNTHNLSKQIYRLRFAGENMRNQFDVFLIDRFLNRKAPVNLLDSSFQSFSITNDPASSMAGRFILVFNRRMVLPVTFVAVSAFRQKAKIIVHWKVENEINISNYIVERSGDGNNFSAVNKQSAKNTYLNGYNWTDKEPIKGCNYYRIKSIGVNGEIKYSQIVKVCISKETPSFKIYPNPVKDGIVNLQLINQPEGNYRISVLNSSGQIMASKDIHHGVDNYVDNIFLGKYTAPGIYWVKIIKPDNQKNIMKIEIN